MTFHPLIQTALENIYISPLEVCNLKCKVCYTNKTKSILSNKQILSFVNRYNKTIHLKSVLFCGGEVFLLSGFTALVNQLTVKNIFISVITNGTVDKLDQIKNPNNVQLLVSFDGPKDVHDANRGAGNFDKSINFVKHAISLGFHCEIMFLITPASYPFRDSFPSYLESRIKCPVSINYLTQKTKYFTKDHPLTNGIAAPGLTRDQVLDIKRHYPSIPAKNFGCFQLALQSNGLIYGCCETSHPLAKMSDPIKTIVANFTASLHTCGNCSISALNPINKSEQFSSTERTREQGSSPKVASTAKISSQSVLCNGCCDPNFLCGYKAELNLLNCTDVVAKFN